MKKMLLISFVVTVSAVGMDKPSATKGAEQSSTETELAFQNFQSQPVEEYAAVGESQFISYQNNEKFEAHVRQQQCKIERESRDINGCSVPVLVIERPRTQLEIVREQSFFAPVAIAKYPRQAISETSVARLQLAHVTVAECPPLVRQRYQVSLESVLANLRHDTIRLAPGYRTFKRRRHVETDHGKGGKKSSHS